MFQLFESHFVYWSTICFPIVFLLPLVLHLAVTQISNPSPSFQFRKYLSASICPTKTLQRVPGNASKFALTSTQKVYLSFLEDGPALTASGIFLKASESYFSIKGWIHVCYFYQARPDNWAWEKWVEVSRWVTDRQGDTCVHAPSQASKLRGWSREAALWAARGAGWRGELGKLSWGEHSSERVWSGEMSNKGCKCLMSLVFTSFLRVWDSVKVSSLPRI